MIIYPYRTWILANPPAVPALYFNVVSQEQRLKAICTKLAGLEGYMKYLSGSVAGLEDEIIEKVDEIVADTERRIDNALSALSADIEAQLDDLRAWVREQTFSMSQWDVTRGLATSSVEAMRRTFFDVTVFGTTVDNLNESDLYPTVDALARSGWNCRALAVIGARVLGDTGDMSPWVVPGGGTGETFDAEALGTAVIHDEGFVVVP